MNYKYWITCRADEISLEEYDVELDELEGETKAEVYDQACQDYGDMMANMIDARMLTNE